MSLVALVHLGSANVRAGLLKDGKLVKTSERECSFQAQLDTNTFLDTVARALKDALAALAQAKLGAPERVVIFLSSPLVAGRLAVLKQENTKPFRVTERTISALVDSEQAKLKNDKQHQVIDSKIMRFALNGYVVTTPHGQKAKSLEVAHYLSVAPAEAVKKFNEVVKNVFHHLQVEYHSASFAHFLALRTEKPTENSFLLVDVGGEVTELTLVWQGIIQETLSYPLGSHATLRESDEHGLPKEVAKAEASKGKKTNTGSNWQAAFREGLKTILQHRFWSGDIILTSEDQALTSNFVSLLEGAELDKVVFSAKKLTVQAPDVPLLAVETSFMLR